MHQRWSAIEESIRQFREQLSPMFPDLQFLHAYDANWSKEEWAANRLKGFSSNLRGVYLAFDENETLQYVGVASTNFSKRVWSHDDWLTYRFIDIIPFDDQHFHFALALEYFLISRLKPKQNTAFRGHTN